MFVQPRPSVVDRLVPEVEVVRRDAFKLRDDLQRLDSVQQAGALDAVAFYGSRILEVLTGEALGAVGLKVLAHVAANLDTLYQFSLLPAPTLSWAHVLRHKGNDARHIRCQLSEDDVELVLALLTRWLRWYFCAFRDPNPLPQLTRDGGPLWDTDRQLEAFIDLLERREFALDEVRRSIEAGADPVWLRSPALAAVLAEMLIERGQREHARKVLDAGRARFPLDLRLQQLWGLWLSRCGRLDEAVAVLEPLCGLNSTSEDAETHGILAGAFKRCWQETRDATWLRRSQQAYTQGWKRSYQTSPYHGVNAAALALWLGQGDEAARMALGVCDLLRDREATARRRGPRLTMSFWDRVTLAEALLLCGETNPARHAYCGAFADHPDRTESIAIARAQALRHLPYLGLASLADRFFDDPTPGTSA